jgi:hypothetical protein
MKWSSSSVDCSLRYVEDPPSYCFGQASDNDYEERGKENLKMKNLKFKPALLLGVAARTLAFAFSFNRPIQNPGTKRKKQKLMAEQMYKPRD